MKNTSNNCSLSESELIQLKKDVRKELSLARHNLLAFYPFIGSIALRMDLIPIRDFRVRTSCTDGHDVYFDISFYKSLTKDEREFVLAHEVWHAVLLHLVRLQNRIPNIFNMATDMEVNHMLKTDGFTPPKCVLLPPNELEGKCAEEIYEYLINQAKSNKNKKQSNNDNIGNDKDNGNGINGQFDKHIYDNNESPNDNNNFDNDDDDNIITDEYGEIGIDSDFRPSISKDFADKMREVIVSATQHVEKIHGSLPQHIRELVKKLTTPEINWKERIAQFVTRSFQGSQRTWIPPNRRHIHRGLYLQRSQSTKLKAIVAIDTSGSTIGDRSKFLSELNGLVESFGDYELTIICCDCNVDSCEVYSRDNPLDIKNCGFMVEGGGGTSFFPPFEYIINNQIKGDVMIYCTDGYGEAPKSNPIGIPVMWVITKDGTEDFVKWGEKLKLNFTDKDIK